jgi:hypothetical protein
MLHGLELVLHLMSSKLVVDLHLLAFQAIQLLWLVQVVRSRDIGTWGIVPSGLLHLQVLLLTMCYIHSFCVVDVVLRSFRWHLALLIHIRLFILRHFVLIGIHLLLSDLASLISKQFTILAVLAHEVARVCVTPDQNRIHHRHAYLAAAFSETLLDVLLVELGHHIICFISFLLRMLLLMLKNAAILV